MQTIHIPKLNLEVVGVDETVVRAALEQLPAHLTRALRETDPTVSGERTAIRVSTRTDARALAIDLARHISAVVHQRTRARGERPSTPGTARTAGGA